MSAGGTSENPDASATDVEVLKRERYELLQRVRGWLETPMLVLAFVWLVLLVVELTRGESQLFYFLGTTIWVVFILDFAVKLVLAPDKAEYFTGNWLTAMSLLIPALGSSASCARCGLSAWLARGGVCGWSASLARRTAG